MSVPIATPTHFPLKLSFMILFIFSHIMHPI